MQIGVAYSENAQQVWMTIEVPEDATVADAIALKPDQSQPSVLMLLVRTESVNAPMDTESV